MNPNDKHFVRLGSEFHVASNADRYTNIPVGNYIVKQDPISKEYYLELVSSFRKPKKVYGNYETQVARFVNTYKLRNANTGILLSGEKGSGKTLMARLISIQAAEQDIPTIIINESHSGDEFNKFLQDIKQETVIVFDEFEKVYDYSEQIKLLTLLDGVFPSKKLFIFTSNDSNSLERHLINRPGRIYYAIKFGGLDTEFIKEYCEEHLQNQKFIDDIARMASIIHRFNFDMLSALIEEMNRYGESPLECVKYLNISVDSSSGSYFTTLFHNNEQLKNVYPSDITGHPLSKETIVLEYDDKNGDEKRIVFTPADLASVNSRNGTFEFFSQNREYKLIVTKKIEQHFSFDDPYFRSNILI